MRYLTAGESHGKGLIGIIEGFPSNVEIDVDKINTDLLRRQKGYGRGKRMNIETDSIEIFSGVRFGKTMGSPISFLIKNKDWENWKLNMSCCDIYHNAELMIKAPRPGHADLPGAIKYNQEDVRNILERASARETAARTAIGSIAKQLLEKFGIFFKHRVVSIGSFEDVTVKEKGDNYWDRIAESEVSMYDAETEKKVKAEIDKIRESGDTLGGIIEVLIYNLPIGLGSHVHFDRKLDGILAQEIMSLQAVKGFEIGAGFESAKKPGSKIHDEIFYNESKFFHKTNNAGGIEGGMSNGEIISFKAALKPIPTLMKPLLTVDMDTKEKIEASKERSDVCAAPAAGVIMENIAAWVICNEMIKKFGGDSLEEMQTNYKNYINYINNR